MDRPFIHALFYETYHYCSIIKNVLFDQLEYMHRLNDFYGDENYYAFTPPFPRYSAFHSYLEFVIDDVLTDTTLEFDLNIRKRHIEQYSSHRYFFEDDPTLLPIENAFSHHGLTYPKFSEWLAENGKKDVDADGDDVYEYMNKLRLEGPFFDLVEQFVRETFYVLFGNRQLLLLFNEMMAQQVSESKLDEMPEEFISNFKRDGVLKRCRIPQWVQRAVFYRDRGLCVSCKIDLSGLINVWSEKNFDHMVPLAHGGLNDVTNIQLLCNECNQKKKDHFTMTSSHYEDWYLINENIKSLDADVS